MWVTKKPSANTPTGKCTSVISATTKAFSNMSCRSCAVSACSISMPVSSRKAISMVSGWIVRGLLMPRVKKAQTMGSLDPAQTGKTSNARMVPGPPVAVKTRTPAMAAPATEDMTANSFSPR